MSPRERIEAALDEMANLAPRCNRHAPRLHDIETRIRTALAEMEAAEYEDRKYGGLGDQLDAALARLAALAPLVEAVLAWKAAKRERANGVYAAQPELNAADAKVDAAQCALLAAAREV